MSKLVINLLFSSGNRFLQGPYVYDLEEKCPIFAFPSSFCLSVQLGPNCPPLTPGRRNVGYQPPPPPSPSVFLQKLGMLRRKPKCSLKPSFPQNQTLVCLKHLQQNETPVWNTYSRTRHLSGTVWTLITLTLIIAVDFQFLWIPSSSPCKHPLPSEFLPFFTIFTLPPIPPAQLLDVINVWSLRHAVTHKVLSYI